MWVSNNWLPAQVYATEPEQTWCFRHFLSTMKPCERDRVSSAWSPREKAVELARRYNTCVSHAQRLPMPVVSGGASEDADDGPVRVHRASLGADALQDRLMSVRVVCEPPPPCPLRVKWIALDVLNAAKKSGGGFRLSSSHDTDSLPLHPAGLPILPLLSCRFEFECHVQSHRACDDFPCEVHAELRLAHLPSGQRRKDEALLSHGPYPVIEDGRTTGELVEFWGGVAHRNGSLSSPCCCCFPWRAAWTFHPFYYS